jgi:glycosyltransferase involved in cell wall biosynthesis
VRPCGLLWEGSFFAHQSLANVNREVALELARRDDVDLGLILSGRQEFGNEIDPSYRVVSALMNRRPHAVKAHVRHRWPPDFAPPGNGRFIVYQPWEYGFAPTAWIERMNSDVYEVWAPSKFVRDVYVRSGVDAGKVAVVQLGVDPHRFRPEAAPFTLRTRKTFKFLYVGGTIERKGFDLLLRAYAAEFTAADDVCLVVKDFFYGPYGRELVRELRRDPRAPEVAYGYGTLSPDRIPGLFTACDCYVQPYRGEGFGLPIAEAMACGLPVIVTGAGAALDYCTEETAFLVPAREVEYPYEWPEELPTVRPATWLEPDEAELRHLMRYVFEHEGEARERAGRASAHVRTHVTWAQTADAVVGRLRVA